jgi:hypothetical protein
MDRQLEARVRERAKHCCEYCRMPEQYEETLFEIDHIISEQHGGKTILSNLALACFADNRAKGPNLTGIDPDTGRITRLYHPRRHTWSHHFRWAGPLLLGRTAIGRTTVAVLNMNAAHRVALRQALIEEGVFPP